MSSTQVRRYGSMAALVAGGLVAGGILAGTLTASATDTPSPTATATGEAPSNPNPGNPRKPQRSDETVLTGTTAAKVKAAVLAEYPDAKIVRIETDSDGVYEAHITKADSTEVAIEVDKSFAVTGVEQCHGGHHGGPGGHHGDHDGDRPDRPGAPGSTTGTGASA